MPGMTTMVTGFVFLATALGCLVFAVRSGA